MLIVQLQGLQDKLANMVHQKHTDGVDTSTGIKHRACVHVVLLVLALSSLYLSKTKSVFWWIVFQTLSSSNNSNQYSRSINRRSAGVYPVHWRHCSGCSVFCLPLRRLLESICVVVQDAVSGFWVSSTNDKGGGKSVLLALEMVASIPRSVRVYRPKIGSSCRTMKVSELKMKMKPCLDHNVAHTSWDRLYEVRAVSPSAH